MKTVKFKVKEQSIKNVDSVAFIYGGTNNYLNLKFEFDDNWNDCIKVISFIVNKKESVSLKINDDSCLVPINAFDKDKLSFYILGGRKDGYRVRTETFIIRLGG